MLTSVNCVCQYTKILVKRTKTAEMKGRKVAALYTTLSLNIGRYAKKVQNVKYDYESIRV